MKNFLIITFFCRDHWKSWIVFTGQTSQLAKLHQVCAGQTDRVHHLTASLNLTRDAVVDNKQKRVGFGIVVRYNKGEVMACLCSSQPFYSLPTFVEFLTL